MNAHGSPRMRNQTLLENQKLKFSVFLSILLVSVFFLNEKARGGEGETSPQDSKALISFPVEKFVLKNGLRVLLLEDRSSPSLTYHQWFNVGSRNEKVGRTGLAHFFEHLMFKGTKKFAGADFDRMIQRNGGNNNAFTSRDYTGYYTNFPSDKLDLIVKIESDRMVNLIFDPKQIQSEREVVKEERRFRTENSVSGTLREAKYKTVFKVHPYRWPVIGSMRDLNAASIKDLKEFYRIYYAPNNAVIVVVGDFDRKKARKLIESHYSSIPRQKLPEVKNISEPKQRAARKVRIKKDVQSPTISVAYQATRAGDAESYAFDLLSEILGGGESSRLYRKLVSGTQQAQSVSAFAHTPREPGVFSVTAKLKPRVSTAGVFRAFEAELGRLRSQKVSAKELEKAKNQVLTGYVSSLRTMAGKARALAANEVIHGDYQHLYKDFDLYQAVTAEDIQNVAKKYLNPSQKSTFVISR